MLDSSTMKPGAHLLSCILGLGSSLAFGTGPMCHIAWKNRKTYFKQKERRNPYLDLADL